LYCLANSIRHHFNCRIATTGPALGEDAGQAPAFARLRREPVPIELISEAGMANRVNFSPSHPAAGTRLFSARPPLLYRSTQVNSDLRGWRGERAPQRAERGTPHRAGVRARWGCSLRQDPRSTRAQEANGPLPATPALSFPARAVQSPHGVRPCQSAHLAAQTARDCGADQPGRLSCDAGGRHLGVLPPVGCRSCVVAGLRPSIGTPTTAAVASLRQSVPPDSSL